MSRKANADTGRQRTAGPGSPRLRVAPGTADGRAEHYRCFGVGVGPANLSLAAQLHRHAELPNLFVDKKNRFGWHDGQQVPGASLQVSPLRDLVTLCDPTNEFSFLAYLHHQGRIYQFLNAQFDAVPREEFRNYLEWASRRNANVVFGEEVRSVGFDGTFVVTTTERTVTADNIVVGVGSRPWIPPAVRDELGDTMFHVSEFVGKTAGLGGKRVSVVGGGQSGAEAFLDLISRPPGELPRQVSWLSRRRNYFPLDDSPFTNEFYAPSYSDYFYGLDPKVRETVNSEQILTSDGISESTLRQIYQRAYLRRFIDGARDLIALYPNREVVRVTPRFSCGWDLTVTHNDHPGETERVQADVVVLATGFRPASTDFLAPIEGRLEREGAEYRVDEDFAAQWDGPADRNVFVQNAVRQQRGLADPNLSLIAWRSRRIMDRIRGIRGDHQAGSLIEWSARPSGEERRQA